MAYLALERWTPRRIARAFARAGRANVLPYLNQVRTISVELPLYQIRLLHYLAEMRSGGRPRLTVSDVLEYELAALAAEEEPDVIDREIAGFEGALNFPSTEHWPQVFEIQCLFCGTAIDERREICAACVERHAPADDGCSRDGRHGHGHGN